MSDRSSRRQRIDPILRDRPANLRFILESEEYKFQTLVKKTVLETYHLQPHRMHNMKQWLELIVPIQWRRVFAIDCIPYRELVLEFFSTFSILTDVQDINYPMILFKLGGVMRSLSLKQFALRLGIYTTEEIEQGMLGTWYTISALQYYEFWKGLVEYKDFRIMYIQDSRHRILYQLISAALFGHREIIGNLDHTDITIMYSILKSRFLCPALYIAKACMEKFPGNEDTHTICGGKIATRLAESYGLLTADFISTLRTPVGRVFILDIRTNKRLEAIEEPNHKSWVMLHDASPDDTPAQEIHPEAIHVETTESDVYRPVYIEEVEPRTFHSGTSSFHTSAFSSIPDDPSLQNMLQLPLPEMPSHLSLEELIREISQPQTFYPGASSSHPGASTSYQDIPEPLPDVPVQLSFNDLVKEVQELKKTQQEIKNDLADMFAWMRSRFPDPWVG